MNRPPTSRLPSLDAARVLATFGIVFSHSVEMLGGSPSTAALGRFGTSFYVIAAIYFSVKTALGKGRTDWFSKRAKRLLTPYLSWCVIYALFYLSTMLPQGASILDITRHWGLLAGTAIHLWFLPFALVVSVGSHALAPRLFVLPMKRLVALGVLTSALAYSACYTALALGPDRALLASLGLHRVDRWLEELPLAVTATFGVVIYLRELPRLAALGFRRRTRLSTLALGGFALAEAAYFFLLEPLRPHFWTEVRPLAHIAGALLFFTIVSRRRSRLIERIAPLGAATYFAFLAHVLVLDLIKVPLARLLGSTTPPFQFLVAVVVLGTCLALGHRLRRSQTFDFLAP